MGGVTRVGNCSVEKCSAIPTKSHAGGNKYHCPVSEHAAKYYVSKAGWSAKKFFKGILNVGAIVCAVMAAIVQPEIAVVAIGAAIGCAQALWDLGSEELKDTFRWFKPSKKRGQKATPADLMYTQEEALGTIEFKMQHVAMDPDFKKGLQSLKNVFNNHKTKSKVLTQDRRCYQLLITTKCTKCEMGECPKCKVTTYNKTGNTIKDCRSKPCGGTKTWHCEPSHSTVTLEDYDVKLQANWNLHQAKRTIKEIFRKLHNTQKGITYKQEVMQNKQALMLETLEDTDDKIKTFDDKIGALDDFVQFLGGLVPNGTQQIKAYKEKKHAEAEAAAETYCMFK